MEDWLRSTREQHPWLATVVLLYLLLSSGELVRVLAYDRPRTGDAGTYDWEETPRGEDAAPRFHWTGAEARLLRPVGGALLRLPLRLSRPDMPGQRVQVTIRIQDRRVEELVLDRNGWFEVRAFLPPILGASLWQEVETTRQPEEGIDRATAPGREGGGWLDNWWGSWQELGPWHPPVGPPSVWIGVQVDPTFVPAELDESSEDHRTLGVALGDVGWRSDLPPEGHGFYAWETEADGTRFRWTRRWASQPVTVPPRRREVTLSISVRATHPDIAARPVGLTLYWGAREIARETLVNAQWRDLRVTIDTSAGPAVGAMVEGTAGAAETPEGQDRPSATAGVLTFEVDRTWSPRTRGLSADGRQLGIAVSDIRWVAAPDPGQ